MTANEAQYEAARRLARRFNRPQNRRDAWKRFEEEEARDESRWIQKGGNS